MRGFNKKDGLRRPANNEKIRLVCGDEEKILVCNDCAQELPGDYVVSGGKELCLDCYEEQQEES